ncbi:MAG: aldehyde ferredoxin oxidoreductase family protein, partial [Firmicutes bacterium]|nr:aldehyde ferredoxin oxidoreductase family protein [Bacillota bacterium]
MPYAGRILKVDLTRKVVSREPTPEHWKSLYIGGRGFCTRALYEMVPPGTDPLSPANVLVFAVGPLSGTLSPSSGRFTVGCKSPATGLLGDANSGGFFGPELKYAGYDALIIKGASDRPVYLLIEDDWAEIRDASDLVGSGVFRTIDVLTDRHGPDTRVVSIGPAGENLVPYACIMTDKHNAAGRTGVGAVMGSKKLNAIAVRGSHDLYVEDVDGFLAKVRQCHEKLMADKTYPDFSETGTPILVDIAHSGGGLSTKNGQFGLFDGYDHISSAAYSARYRTGSKACFSCILHCKNYARVANPAHACEGMGPEYETLVALGSRVGVSDLDVVLEANQICNDLGLDTISAGTSISFLMECSQRGLVSEKYDWGDGEFVLDALKRIALRQGVGEFLALGVREMSRRIPGSEGYALEVKGLELPAFDVRTGKAFALGEAVASRGGDHLRALPNFELLSYAPEDGVRWFGDPNCVDPYTEAGKPAMVVWHENYAAVCDSVEMCKYCTFATYAILPR